MCLVLHLCYTLSSIDALFNTIIGVGMSCVTPFSGWPLINIIVRIIRSIFPRRALAHAHYGCFVNGDGGGVTARMGIHEAAPH